MTLPVLTAVPEAWEASVVAALEGVRSGLSVVRRCVDLPDLLAAAAAGQGRAVLLSADLRHLDRPALDRLAASRVAVVGLVEPASGSTASPGDAERRLRMLGVGHVLPADAQPQELAALVTLAVREIETGAGAGTAVADPMRALPLPRPATGRDDADDADGTDGAPDGRHGAGESEQPGRVVTVWGPVGAPGRTTVAITLAAELAAAGQPTVLADADTYGASVAQVLGLLDEAPGLAAACRAASSGHLDVPALARLAPHVQDDLRVLTGVSRAARWPELPGGPLLEVLRACRQLAAWTVVDCAAPLEADEELSFDTAAPRRNAATLTALEAADVVLVIGTADPIGLQRLVRGLQELADAVPAVAPRVVVTRVRSSAVGPNPRQLVTDALTRYAGVEEVVLVPDDRPGCDGALLAGRSLTEAAPSSPARLALARLAADLAGRPAPRSGWLRRALLRR